MIMCVLLCYPVSIHMSQLQATGRPISSFHCKSPIRNNKKLSPGFNFHTNYTKFGRICLYPPPNLSLIGVIVFEL